jgi:hypothetical protein
LQVNNKFFDISDISTKSPVEIIWDEKENQKTEEGTIEEKIVESHLKPTKHINKNSNGSVREIIEKKWKEYKSVKVFDKNVIIPSIAKEKNCSLDEAKNFLITKETFRIEMDRMRRNWSYNSFYSNISNNLWKFVHKNIVQSTSPYFFFWLADGSIGVLHNNGYSIREKDTEDYMCSILLLKNDIK